MNYEGRIIKLVRRLVCSGLCLLAFFSYFILHNSSFAASPVNVIVAPEIVDVTVQQDNAAIVTIEQDGTPAVTINSPDTTVTLFTAVTDLIEVVTAGEQGIPGVGVPPGGATGQVLTKTGSADYSTAWQDAAAGVTSWNDLTDKPTIPAAQINSDWTASGTLAEILNKPTIPVACGTDPATAIFDGAPGAPALFCNISGGSWTINYDSNGLNPTAAAAFAVHLFEGSAEVTPLYWSWYTGGASNRIYGSGIASSFTPSVKPAYSHYSSNNYVAVMVTYSSLYGRRSATCGTPIAVTRTGIQGATGATGADGTAATIAVGTVTTVSPSTPASVTNVGTSLAAVFDFSIPKGADGDPGTITQAQILDKIDDASTGILSRRTNSADSDVMFKIMDLAGNTRLYATAAGLLVIQDDNGVQRWAYNATSHAMVMKSSSGRTIFSMSSTAMVL